MPLVAKTLRMGVGNCGKQPNLSDSDPRLHSQLLEQKGLRGQGVRNGHQNGHQILRLSKPGLILINPAELSQSGNQCSDFGLFPTVFACKIT
jgi:hypothetical protein